MTAHREDGGCRTPGIMAVTQPVPVGVTGWVTRKTSVSRRVAAVGFAWCHVSGAGYATLPLRSWGCGDKQAAVGQQRRDEVGCHNATLALWRLTCPGVLVPAGPLWFHSGPVGLPAGEPAPVQREC